MRNEPINQPRSCLRLLEQGPESQFASEICAGGVSTIFGSSDLDGHTLVNGEALGNQLSCSLRSGAKAPIVRTACLRAEEETKGHPGEPGFGATE